ALFSHHARGTPSGARNQAGVNEALGRNPRSQTRQRVGEVMHRREPPPQATWMLEHLTSGTRNEALAGDLLEELRAGRTNAWYWRQALSACAVSWSKSLAVRGPMLSF